MAIGCCSTRGQLTPLCVEDRRLCCTRIQLGTGTGSGDGSLGSLRFSAESTENSMK
jgi:hypothetical protein